MQHRMISVRKLLAFTVPLAILGACGGSTEPTSSATQMTSVTGELQITAPNTAVGTVPTVKVADAQGNGVKGVAVKFAPSTSASTVAGGDKVTDENGIARPDSWTLGKAPGRYTLRVTATGLKTLNFEAMATATAIATGNFHTCALVAGGAAFCWGNNTSGELGIGSVEGRTLPSAVAGENSFTSIAAGGAHTCALTSSGAAFCWGSNTVGQLGDGTTTNRNSPTPVGGGLTFQSLALGDQHTCGITSAGATHCWGLNAEGQLGDGTTTDRSTPTAVAGGLTFQSITAGLFHTCARVSTGAAHCWGQNTNGQLGDESTTSRSAPVAVSGGISFQTLAAGSVHTCGLTAAGAAHCWGHNGNGELGNAPTGAVRPDQLSPVAVAMPTGVTLTTISAGGRITETLRQGTTCGFTAAGIAYCWGHNGFAQLGDRSTSLRLSPVAVTGGVNFQRISSGGSYNCGLTIAGVLYCWGRNNLGQLGTGTGTNSLNTATRVVAAP